MKYQHCRGKILPSQMSTTRNNQRVREEGQCFWKLVESWGITSMFVRVHSKTTEIVCKRRQFNVTVRGLDKGGGGGVSSLNYNLPETTISFDRRCVDLAFARSYCSISPFSHMSSVELSSPQAEPSCDTSLGLVYSNESMCGRRQQ